MEVRQWEGTLVPLGSEFPEARFWAEFKAWLEAGAKGAMRERRLQRGGSSAARNTVG